ncbi:MAG: beta-galactosidase [Aquiluna sp.]|nr:beta-galactosidase [Aquiluna sp.]MCF8545322.1 beta-galactosidase [Aquiluna sp.]
MLNLHKLHFGGDYNPEQWPKEVWQDDVRLMQKANVNLVSLGIFSWAKIERSEGEYHFEWLDEVMDLLHKGGINVDMATATASPPAWMALKYPEMLPINFDGVQLTHGGRQAYCAASPVYRDRAAKLVEKIAERYSKHPAVKMWHVNNEYGCHAPYCYCDTSKNAFVAWLKNKYSSLDELNASWGTDFWSQRYYNWEEIVVPKRTPDGTHPNPGQQLDFKRFSSDVTLELFKMERDIIKKYDTVNPVTTNFMSMKFTYAMDYFAWAKEVDFVSTDHYLAQHDELNHIDLAQMADLTRAFANGNQWLLMEHSSSAVNWQPRNYAKTPGQEKRNAMSFVARGSQGAMYFQWRQGQAGSERMHSSMVPHAGEDTRVYREVAELGALLAAHPEISEHANDKAKVAMVYDYEQFWAMMQANLPTEDLSYSETVATWYRALWELGIQVDFVPADSSSERLAEYKLVLMPMVHMLSEQEEKIFSDYAKNGGNLVVGYFSNITDRTLRVKLGGYGGRLVKELIGVYVEELYPLRPGQELTLSNGLKTKLWSELSRLNGAEMVASFAGSDVDGSVAIAKRTLGSSTAWYQGTELLLDSQKAFFAGIAEQLGIQSEGGNGVEITRRGPYRFEIDHNQNSVSITK